MKKLIYLSNLLLVLVSCSGYGQNLPIKDKHKIIKELSDIIQKNYVLQDSVGYLVSELKKARHTKKYLTDHTADEFATYLLQLLRSITQDVHFAVLHDQKMFALALAMQRVPNGASGPPNMSVGGRNLGDPRKNFFFNKLEILQGNVGYLNIEQMPPLEAAKATVDASMAFLKHTDALIIDLRSNPGGVGGFIPYLISYFVPKQKQLLYTRAFMAWDSTSYHYTHEDLGEERYLDKPVYILTSRFTGSAATNMTYTMKSFDLATIVGENTGSGYRGAHSATLFALKHNLVALVPIGKVINAKTKTNWRSNGVDPHIICEPTQSLDVAHKNAIKVLMQQSQSPELKSELQEVLDKLQAKSPQESKPSADLSEYVGQYGETTITLEGNRLFTKRPTTPIKLELRRKRDELFEIILPGNARGNVPDLRFNRENGAIVSITTVRNGVNERTEKKN